VIAHNI